MANEVNAAIENICNKIGMAYSNFVPEYTRYNIARDVFAIILCLLSVTGIICVIRFYYKKYSKAEKYSLEKEHF